MSLDDKKIEEVWQKARTVSEWNDSEWRKDECGAPINRKKHGDRESNYGWEAHHIDGNSENNVLSNLLPLQWKNNLARGDTPNSNKCEVTG